MADRVCSVCLTNPVALQCTCIANKVFLCYQCIPSHSREAGEHEIQPYEVPTPHNVHCKLCSVRAAVHMCACNDVATPLCVPCSEKHRVSKFYDRHPFFDIRAYPHFSPGYIANYEARQEGVREALNQLKVVITSMEAAEDKVNRHFEEMRAIITTCRDEKLSELRKLKTKFQQQIERASQEVGDHIYEREYQSADQLANDIWNFSIQPVSFQCFDFICDNYSVSPSIRNSVYFNLDISKRNSFSSLIPVFSEHEIRNWDTRLKTWTAPTTLSRSIEFNRDCAWVLTEQGRIALCGGQKVHRDVLKCACLIDRNTGQVSELPPMIKARSNHALAYIDNTLCVFGGWNAGSLTSCEMLGLGNRQWETLGNMNESRSFCTACLYNSFIYLSGGYGTVTTERFDWKSRSFSLQLKTDDRWFSTCFVLSDELITVDCYHSYRWNLSSNTLRKQTTQRTACGWSNCPAIFSNGNVYIVNLFHYAMVELKVSEAEISVSEYSLALP